jgi:hypothetical protein
MSVAIASVPPLPEVPYPGIEAFRFIDQQILAARADEAWELISNVTLYSAVLLYGDSGVGKSSLINAGLLPEAIKENYRPDRLRVQPYAGREIKVERIEQTSGEHAIYLRSNFTPRETDEDSGDTLSGSESFELPLTDFRQQLRDACLFGRASEAADSFSRQGTTRPLIIFDQFEEFVTLFEEVRRGGPTVQAKVAQEQADQVQREILTTLVELVQGKEFAVTVVFSFREDYLAKLSILFDACPELREQSQRLLPPTFEEVPAIIRAPFDTNILREHFLEAEPGGPAGSELSESLARRISRALQRRSEGEPVNLTELQIVCQRLWQSKDREALFKKGVDHILSDYAAEVFGGLPRELRDGGIGLLSHMVTGSNTRNIISEPDLLSRTMSHVDVPQTQLLDTLELMSKGQLIRRERRRNLHFYELASEYFVPWITKQVAERVAMEEQSKAKNARRLLVEQRAQARREWRRARRYQRLLKAFAVLVGVLFLVAAIAGYTYKRSVNTDRRLMTETSERRAAEAKTEAALDQNEKYEAAITAITGPSDEEKLRALAKMKQWVKEGDLPPKFALVSFAAQSATENVEVKQAALELLAQAVETDPKVADSIGAVAKTDAALAEKLPPRFYIHVADESQRGPAQKLRSALTEQGWVVPGIEIVGGRAPVWNNELRYFRKSEAGVPEAKEILKVLKEATNSNWEDSYVPGYESSSKVPSGSFEVWFAAPTGRLVVSFQDRDGNLLKPTLVFQPTVGSGGVPFKSRSSTISVPPGDYAVKISASGYKTLTRGIFIRGNEQVNWPVITLENDNP